MAIGRLIKVVSFGPKRMQTQIVLVLFRHKIYWLYSLFLKARENCRPWMLWLFTAQMNGWYNLCFSDLTTRMLISRIGQADLRFDIFAKIKKRVNLFATLDSDLKPHSIELSSSRIWGIPRVWKEVRARSKSFKWFFKLLNSRFWVRSFHLHDHFGLLMKVLLSFLVDRWYCADRLFVFRV